MSYKPILLVHGEPNSIFLEIFFKAIKSKKYKNPLLLICSVNLLKLNLKKFKFKKKIKLINISEIKNVKLSNRYLNVIDVNYNKKNKFSKISKNSNLYIKKSFEIAFKILRLKITNKLINGPISKKKFLDKRYLGMTEYISDKVSRNKTCMLIYNKKLSVCPVTTHLPIKEITKKINRKNISEKIILINNFYRNKLGYKPKIAILGLNPHCETIDKFDEDEKIIKPTVKYLKKKINVSGPYPADTIFLKDNRKNFNVIVGMYHDQVLTPLKTLYEYDAINITLGLPFTRISPDHGPNEKMVGKNISNPLSLIRAIEFLDTN